MAGTDITFSIKAIDGTRAAFVSVSNSLSRLNKETKAMSGLFKAGLGVMGAGSVFSMLSHQVRDVIQNIESIPGIPQKTRDSVIGLRNDFKDIQGVTQQWIASGLAFVDQAIEGIAIDLAVLTHGVDATKAALAERDAGRQKIKDLADEAKATEEMIKLRAKLNDATGKAGKAFGPELSARQQVEAHSARQVQIMMELEKTTGEGNVVLEKRLRLFEDLAKTNEQLADSTERATRDGRRFGEGLAFSFENAVFSGGKLKDIVNSIIADIGGMLFRQLVTMPLARGLGGIFGGFFADGGVPPAGKVSIVGENGPEPIVGNGIARVLPSGSFGGGSVTLYQTNYYSSGVQAAQLAQFAEAQEQSILAKVSQAIRSRKMTA